MIIDFYTKTVLTMIAVALAVIALNPWVIPNPARADVESDMSSIASDVTSMRFHVDRIYNGLCLNDKLC